VTRPLRIAFVAYRGNMRCGGQGVYLWFLARELSRQGHRVDVFVGPPYPDPMPFANRVEELPNEQFWGGWFSRDPARMLPKPNPYAIFAPLNFYELVASWFGFLPEPFAFSVRAFRAVAARLRAGERYDVIHDVQCLGYGLHALQRLGLPVVSTVHHPLTVDRRASFVRDETLRDAIGTMTFYPIGMQSFVARRVDRLFTSSRVSARQIERDFGVDPARLRMVANGVDTELFRPDRSVARNPREILCVGRANDPNKGIRTLVEAFAKLPSDVRLTLVDEDNPENVGRKRAHELGCLDRVDIVGRVPVEDLVRRYQRATLVAVPSRYEGFGLPAVEAMACGAPVVATRAGALPEVVATGGGGILVERDDPVSLAAGMALLDRDGAVIFESLLDDEVMPQIQAELDAYLARSHLGEGAFWGFKTTRVGALVAKSRTFAERVAPNPSVLAANYDELAAQRNVREVEGELLPTVSLQGSVGYQHERSSRSSAGSSAEVLAVVSVPLYQQGSVSSRVRESKQVASQRRLLVREALRQAREDAIASWESLVTARAQIAAFQQTVRANEIALEGVRQENAVGARTVLDVLDAEQELLDAQVNLVGAQRDEVVAAFSVLTAIGRMTAADLELSTIVYDPEADYRAVREKWFGLDAPGTEDPENQ